jgi:hypothetical protein
MDISLRKGLMTELECQQAFIHLGYSVSVPLGNFDKYDMIADVDGHLLRIQCKSATYDEVGDYISFNCRSVTTNTKKTNRHSYSKDEIDYFATSWNGKVYLVPVNECSVTKKLWLWDTKSDKSTATLAKDCEIAKVLLKIINNEV